MKICIVTLYKTINSGSYLQAYALKKHLESLGNEVYMLKIDYALKNRIKKIINYPKVLINDGINEFKLHCETNKRFNKMQKELDLISYNDAINKIDVFIFGSDTIWNIDSSNILKLRDTVFGMKFKNKKKISYAASFANSKLEKINVYSDIINGLDDFYKISVRDEYSFEIIKKISKNKPILVCDPTILLDKDNYDILISKKESNKYIFTYLFENLSESQINQIKLFAKNKNLKIISGTKKFNWCDKRISNSPDSFLSYVSGAEYVITDTFHGTIFSTIFNKNYVVINRDKKKVNDFLNRCDLTNRLVTDDDVVKKFNNEIDYKRINNVLSEYRKKSINFIDDALK